MLIKEYRICLPLSVQEYRIAQLYMILKKSREESEGEGSGVEILVNEAYEDGPGGKGQYTHKIYHIGSHLPGWFRAILPKSALIVEEKSWNAYPYTKTIYRCPFIEKFNLEIETKYYCDDGHQENVFNLSGAELRNRTLDYIDIVQDPISSGEYKKEEDPKWFQSKKTGRGPLSDDWREEYAQKAKNNPGAIMCAYKLCRVEFKYWGMQSKIERFIHEIGLRKTMVRAHRQAWVWQDEWWGLTIEEIRNLEMETQRALKEKMGGLRDSDEDNESDMASLPEATDDFVTTRTSTCNRPHGVSSVVGQDARVHGILENDRMLPYTATRRKESYSSRHSDGISRSPSERIIEGLEQLKASSSDEEEFFDAQEELESDEDLLSPNRGMIRSSSMEIMSPDDDAELGPASFESEQSPLDRRMEQYRNLQTLNTSHSLDSSLPVQSPPGSAAPTQNCKTTLLFLVLHGGSILDTGQELHGSKYSDISTLKTTFDTVLRAHYPTVHGHVALRLVPCPALCADTLNLLASLSPYSHESLSHNAESNPVINESLPMGAISLFATAAPEYQDCVASVIARTNAVYNDFLRSEEGCGFAGQVCMIGDSTGSLLGYDALCKQNPFFTCQQRSRCDSQSSLNDISPSCDSNHPTPSSSQQTQPSQQSHHVSQKTNLETIKQVSISNPDLLESSKQEPLSTSPNTLDSHETRHMSFKRHSSCPTSRRTSTNSQGEMGKFEFEVTDFFMFGSPLAMVLAFRKVIYGNERIIESQTRDMLPRPQCLQIYNLYHSSDPSAARLEPALVDKFKMVAPVKIPRYQKFPLGDGSSVHVVETIQSNVDLFVDQPSPSPNTKEHPLSLERRQSNMSITSQLSGHGDMTVTSIASITSRWWGLKRLDYALYCPDALQSFPSNALPYLLHASYWESTDVVAFILRQVVRLELVTMNADSMHETPAFQPAQPREKWLKRRTTIKLRNLGPNHRANDVMVLEDKEQILTARFMYGPLDMVSLSGEKVDIHIMTQPPDGPWVYFGTAITDSGGRLTYSIEPAKKLSQGMFPVKMVVRGDHTSVDFYLTVLPPKAEAVVFSIDGSFTASVSIMGKDPKVRAGAVDVVRHWQELGYLIIYITARPDMQHKKVVAWLAQHNFPHGMVSFMDGITSEPLRQKTNYLRSLCTEAKIKLHAAYGSSKDISVYQAVGMQPDEIFIVGKVSKKHSKEAVILSEGYAAHLNELTAHGGSRPAIGNARMFIRKSCFGLPGQHKGSGKRSARRTCSLPQRGASKDIPTITRQDAVPTIGVSEYGNTVVEPGGLSSGKAVRMRGLSPRGKTPHRFETNV